MLEGRRLPDNVIDLDLSFPADREANLITKAEFDRRESLLREMFATGRKDQEDLWAARLETQAVLFRADLASQEAAHQKQMQSLRAELSAKVERQAGHAANEMRSLGNEINTVREDQAKSSSEQQQAVAAAKGHCDAKAAPLTRDDLVDVVGDALRQVGSGVADQGGRRRRPFTSESDQ